MNEYLKIYTLGMQEMLRADTNQEIITRNINKMYYSKKCKNKKEKSLKFKMNQIEPQSVSN